VLSAVRVVLMFSSQELDDEVVPTERLIARLIGELLRSSGGSSAGWPSISWSVSVLALVEVTLLVGYVYKLRALPAWAVWVVVLWVSSRESVNVSAGWGRA
jgi:hypothetical protein